MTPAIRPAIQSDETDTLTTAVMQRYREYQRNPHLHVPAIEALRTDIAAIIAQIKHEKRHWR